MDACHNNPEKSSTTKVSKRTACSHSLFTLCSFDWKDCMKNYCKDLRDHVMKLSNWKRLKMLPLTEKGDKSVIYVQKLCFICKNKFSSDIKIRWKVRNHHHYTGIYRSAAHLIWSLRYKNKNKILVDLQNGSNYDLHLIKKHLDQEFKEHLKWFGENPAKYVIFSVSLEKEFENDKKWQIEQNLLKT